MKNHSSIASLLRLGLMLQAQANPRQIKRRIAKTVLAAALVMLALLLTAGAIAFAFGAFWIFVRPQFGPVNASLATAALLAILAVGLLLAASLMTKGAGRHRSNRPDIRSGVADMEKSIRANKSLFVTAALVAGFLAASGSGPGRSS